MAERTIVIFQRDDDLWDWHCVAPNGEIVFGSLQGFTSESDAHEAAVRETTGVYEDVGTQGVDTAVGGESLMYLTLRPCRRCGNLFPLSVGLLRPVGYDWHATLGVVYECMYRAACDAFIQHVEVKV